MSAAHGLNWADIDAALAEVGEPVVTGRVTRAVGTTAEAAMPGLEVGALVEVLPGGGRPPLEAEVVGVGEGRATLIPVGDVRGIEAGAEVRQVARAVEVGVGREYLGRVVDALGEPLDGGPPVRASRQAPLFPPPINPLDRPPIHRRLALGVRAIDAALTCGRGQRLAIMAGSGVGKTVLLGMVARNSEADVNVLALVGERGREVREFLEAVLDEEALTRTAVVAATSDMPPLLRIRAAHLAFSLAEAFRADGADVLMLVDSVTRIAMAQREVGLAAGEPPTSRGYPPSVYGLIPRLMERAGAVEGQGSVTSLFTVLTEADDLQDPVADAVRATTDGHIVLSRDLTDRGHYPPVDVLRSISRVMPQVVDDEHRALAQRLRMTLAAYAEAEDLINLGAYVSGSNAEIDDAVARIGVARRFLQQGMKETAPWEETLDGLAVVFEEGL